MKEQIIQMIEDKQYKLDKLIVAEMNGTRINKLNKKNLEIEIKTLASVLKLFSIHVVNHQVLENKPQCDYYKTNADGCNNCKYKSYQNCG